MSVKTRFKDIAGQKFGFLTVIEFVGTTSGKAGMARWTAEFARRMGVSSSAVRAWVNKGMTPEQIQDYYRAKEGSLCR